MEKVSNTNVHNVYVVNATPISKDEKYHDGSITISVFEDIKEAFEFMRKYTKEFRSFCRKLKKLSNDGILMADISTDDYPIYFDVINKMNASRGEIYDYEAVLHVKKFEVKKKEVN